MFNTVFRVMTWFTSWMSSTACRYQETFTISGAGVQEALLTRQTPVAIVGSCASTAAGTFHEGRSPERYAKPGHAGGECVRAARRAAAARRLLQALSAPYTNWSYTHTSCAEAGRAPEASKRRRRG